MLALCMWCWAGPGLLVTRSPPRLKDRTWPIICCFKPGETESKRGLGLSRRTSRAAGFPPLMGVPCRASCLSSRPTQKMPRARQRGPDVGRHTPRQEAAGSWVGRAQWQCSCGHCPAEPTNLATDKTPGGPFLGLFE